MRSAQFLEEADHLQSADEEADDDECGEGIDPVPLRRGQRAEVEIEPREPGQDDGGGKQEQLVLLAPDHPLPPEGILRSEARSAGKGCVSTCKSGWSRSHK